MDEEGFDEEFDEDFDESLDEDFDDPSTKHPTTDFQAKTPEHKKSPEGKKISVFFLSTIGPGEKKQKLLVKFNRSQIQQMLLLLDTSEISATLTVAGSLNDGTDFEGEDAIRPIK